MRVDQTSVRASQAGFTLIELMIAVAIVAILAAIAYPSYRQHVVRTNRAAAATCLGETAQFMERFYTTNLRYDQDAAGAGIALPALDCINQLAGIYVVSLAAVGQRTYTLQAAPQPPRQDDPLCGTLSLNEAGARSETGTAASPAECFR